MKTRVWTSAAVFACMTVGLVEAKAQGAADLGKVWTEQEAGWDGVWTRVGQTSTFQAVWTKGNRVVRAKLRMTVNGNIVSIDRDDTSGPGVGKAGCAYTGTIKGNSVAGDYNCAWSKAAGKWKATISR